MRSNLPQHFDYIYNHGYFYWQTGLKRYRCLSKNIRDVRFTITLLKLVHCINTSCKRTYIFLQKNASHKNQDCETNEDTSQSNPENMHVRSNAAVINPAD